MARKKKTDVPEPAAAKTEVIAPTTWETSMTRSVYGFPAPPSGDGWEPFSGGVLGVGSLVHETWVMWKRAVPVVDEGAPDAEAEAAADEYA